MAFLCFKLKRELVLIEQHMDELAWSSSLIHIFHIWDLIHRNNISRLEGATKVVHMPVSAAFTPIKRERERERFLSDKLLSYCTRRVGLSNPDTF